MSTLVRSLQLLRPFGRPGRLALSLVAALLGALAGPAGALAGGLPPGVHVDPGSPAAKEYQIPLGAARGNGQSGGSSGRQLFGSGITRGSGGGNGQSGGSSGRQLFGSGITRGSGGGNGSGATSGATGGAGANQANPSVDGYPAGSPAAAGRSGDHRHRKRGGGPGQSALPTRLSPQRVIGTVSSSGAGIAWMLGAAVIVLLLGALGGTLLARRGRRTSPDPR